MKLLNAIYAIGEKNMRTIAADIHTDKKNYIHYLIIVALWLAILAMLPETAAGAIFAVVLTLTVFIATPICRRLDMKDNERFDFLLERLEAADEQYQEEHKA